ncbi:molybdopterin-dependent oxidoreductase [Nocardia ninae]|uniref:Oxidoreductase n=1 Tax=Nocardia ninae NBRC 108245 TaxID=1210091 RepID=A0A511M501_9NOCA|nr:molybdopterin-dependent oxidoreductase [Nocardia ninae]GEM35710.1 oxidoreductase [Nocardia ninae NBRC 108245]
MKKLGAQARPRHALHRPSAALAGVLAALTVLGVGHLIAALIDPAASPFYAMGASVVDHTPHALKDAAIRRFGSNDKLALFLSMAGVMVVFAAILGLLERRRPLGSVLLILLGGVVLGAALQRPTATGWFALPTVVGVAAGVIVLRLLIGRGSDGRGDEPVAGAAVPPSAGPIADADRSANGDTAARAHAAGSGGIDQSLSAPPIDPPSPPILARSTGMTAATVDPSSHSANTMAGRHSPRRHGRTRSDGASAPAKASRRRFLLLSAGVGAVAVGATVAGQWIGARLRDVVADRAGFIVPRAVPAAPLGSGARLAVPGLTDFVTPNDRFYRVDTALQLPALTSGDWRLRIHGMVDRPMELDFDQLRQRVAVERMITMTCVSNEVGGELAGTAVWTGYRLADLLAEAGVHPEADMLLSRSIDGFTASTPVSAVTDGRDALLAVGMNGEPLPIAHGYPARLIVPGLYGYVSATKWVIDLELTRFDRAEAYWTERGWAAQALIKTAARIDVPAAFATVPAGDVIVAGVAWAQHRGIDAVEVQVDDQPWQPAALADEYSTDTWRLWTWRWAATPGAHTLRVRATDRDGITQTDRRTPPFPDGSTGWHSRVITVR